MQISVNDVGKFVSGCVGLLDAKFALGESLVVEEDFRASQGLLPLVLWHADRLAQFALTRGIALDFHKNQTALLGYEINNIANVSISKHYPIILEGIVQMVETLPKNEAGAVKLDEMANVFLQEVAREAHGPSKNRTAI